MKKEERYYLLSRLEIELVKIHWTINSVNKKFTNDELNRLLSLIERLKKDAVEVQK